MPEHFIALLKALNPSRQSYFKCRRRCQKYRNTGEILSEQHENLLEKQAYNSASDIQVPPSTLAADPQAQSNFFNRLPPEIRRLIYEEAIGGNVFHIVKKADRLGFKKCTGKDKQQTCYSDELWAIESTNGLYRDRTDGGPLSLLLSCRKFHIEAALLLYTHNTFSFQSPSPLLELQTLLPLAYFNRINSLLLNLFLKAEAFSDRPSTPPDSLSPSSSPPQDHEQELDTWRRVWAVIAGMRQLRDVRVTLSMVCGEISDVQEARILGPLCEVRGLRAFDVEVPWTASEEVRDGVPFRIVKCGRARDI